MAVGQEVIEDLHARLGERRSGRLGVVGAAEIRRYARAVGDENPLYYDPEYARERGYADVVAPPNMVPSIMEWGEGESEERLRPDGTAPGELSGLAEAGVRVMGGGEKIVFHRPVVAGTEIHLDSELIEVYEKEGRSGKIVFLVYDNRYADADGEPLLTCRRTVLLR